MRTNLQSIFSTRQYMYSKDFEIYYYNDTAVYKVDLHAHDYYEFYFYLEGNVSIEIENKSYSLKYGDMVVIPPCKQHHAIVHDVTVPYRRLVFWISKDYLENLKGISADYSYLMEHVISSNTYIFHNDILTFNTIQTKCFQLLEEYHTNRFGKDARLSLCVNDLVLHLNRLVYEQTHPSGPQMEQYLYQNVLNYITENLSEDISLDTLAHTFFASKYHISHVFKEHIGISIHQYITKKRLQACKNAILNNVSIGDAYLMYGFKDYSAFFRAFKKEYGMSPTDFKKHFTYI